MHPHLQDGQYFINLSVTPWFITFAYYSRHLEWSIGLSSKLKLCIYQPGKKKRRGKKTITCPGTLEGGYFLSVNLQAAVLCPLCLHHALWLSHHYQALGWSPMQMLPVPSPAPCDWCRSGSGFQKQRQAQSHAARWHFCSLICEKETVEEVLQILTWDSVTAIIQKTTNLA